MNPRLRPRLLTGCRAPGQHVELARVIDADALGHRTAEAAMLHSRMTTGNAALTVAIMSSLVRLHHGFADLAVCRRPSILDISAPRLVRTRPELAL